MELPKDLSKSSVEEIESLIQKAKAEVTRLERELLTEIISPTKEEKSPESEETAPKKPKTESSTENLQTSETDKSTDKENEKTDNEKKDETSLVKSKKETKPKFSGIWEPPKHCIPMRADVRNFDFNKLITEQKRKTGRLFDVIMTDPPWQLATSNPTRGVAIGYQQLSDTLIEAIPFGLLQENGYIFIWVINAKYRFALDLMEKWGYDLVDEVVWVKSTVNRRLAKSHGYYLQHAKETCLVGKKGSDPPNCQHNIDNDVIYSVRRGQSQKPVEIYEMIERLVPGGYYLEIFARRNNLRNYWASIGNEL